MNVLHRKKKSPCCAKNNSTSTCSTTSGRISSSSSSSNNNNHLYSPIRTPSCSSSSSSSQVSFSSCLWSYKTCLFSTAFATVFFMSYLHIMSIVQLFLATNTMKSAQIPPPPPPPSSTTTTTSLPSQEEHEMEQKKLLTAFNTAKTLNSNDQNCTFQKPYSEAPVPLILMAMGRAGSSVTWNTLSTLLGSTTTAYEITGGNRTKSLNFFNDMQQDGDSGDSNNGDSGLNWAVERLCHTQQYNLEHVENPVITGFQWKPYRVTLNHEFGKGALKILGKYNTNSNSNTTNSEKNDDIGDKGRRPNIKVLLLSRNPLDRLISNIRHKGHIRSEEMPAHCAIDDTDCVNRHRAYAKGTILPIGKELIHSMRSGLQIDRLCKTYLTEYGVDYLAVQYEQLFNDDGNVDEWIKIFDFLGRAPKDVVDYKTNLTMEDIRRAFAMAPTSSKKHVESIANYDEVKQTLEGAGLTRLLH